MLESFRSLNRPVCRDKRNTENGSKFFGESEGREVVSTFPIEPASFDGIDMGEDEVYGIPDKGVKRGIGRSDVSEKDMVLFNAERDSDSRVSYVCCACLAMYNLSGKGQLLFLRLSHPLQTKGALNSSGQNCSGLTKLLVCAC